MEKEVLGGQVQMSYIDPRYGIRYGSNFQPFTNKRDVKDGADEDLTQEPETLKAFRDTWELGIHSYATPRKHWKYDAQRREFAEVEGRRPAVPADRPPHRLRDRSISNCFPEYA